jgi:hypothetical protein
MRGLHVLWGATNWDDPSSRPRGARRDKEKRRKSGTISLWRMRPAVAAVSSGTDRRLQGLRLEARDISPADGKPFVKEIIRLDLRARWTESRTKKEGSVCAPVLLGRVCTVRHRICLGYTKSLRCCPALEILPRNSLVFMSDLFRNRLAPFGTLWLLMRES